MHKRAVDVWVPIGHAHAFTYAVPDGQIVEVGSLVRVPFRKGDHIGVVAAFKDEAPANLKIKDIYEILPYPPLKKSYLDFLAWVARYTLTPVGLILKMGLSSPSIFKELKRVIKPKNHGTHENSPGIIQLNEEQQQVLDSLKEKLHQQAYSTSLIDGVTGSGKTEVYFELIAEALSMGKQCLVLLPEIALSAQWHKRFTARFGVAPLEWHSHLTPARKRETWKAIVSGEAKVVVGARSALFLPYKKLGLCVVDEEHETSYRQEDGVRYHARDIAMVRGVHEKFPVVLVSATPSLETMVNVERGKVDLFLLRDRYGVAQMPNIQLIDLKEQGLKANRWLSPPLVKAMSEALGAGEQVLLFLNRRGFSPLTLCGTCGHRFACDQCSAWLVEHKSKKTLLCHHCGYQMPFPKNCPTCHDTDSLRACGPGVERIVEEVTQFFPTARVLEMSSDTVDDGVKLREAIKAIETHEVDIIVGTQMVAKGHHFPDLTVVGIVDADMGLSGSDLRATEKTYQVIHQVTGRAGRDVKAGRAIVQTYFPDHPIFEAIKTNERRRLYALESQGRKAFSFPPYGRLAAFIVSGTDVDKVSSVAQSIRRFAPTDPRLQVLGPAPAPLAKIRGKYRFRLLLKTPLDVMPQNIIQPWLAQVPCPSSVHVQVDIDPYSFL